MALYRVKFCEACNAEVLHNWDECVECKARLKARLKQQWLALSDAEKFEWVYDHIISILDKPGRLR